MILAVPFRSVDATLDEVRSSPKDGSAVIDVTVPVTSEDATMAMLVVPEGSASGHLRARLPAGVFKTIPATCSARSTSR